MSDIVISPIPYYGGSLYASQQVVSYCYLGNGKYLHVFSQQNPNYIYAFVSNQANVATGTFATSTGQARAILANANAPAVSTMRVFKMTATSAALCLNGKMYALTLDASDNVTLKTGTVASICTGQIWNGSNYNYATTGALPSGSYWQVHYARDNVLYVTELVGAANNTLSITLKKVVYNPGLDSFTVTLLNTWTASTVNTASSSWMRTYLQSIPGSTSLLFSIRAFVNASGSNYGGMAASSIQYAAIIDQTDTVNAIPVPPSSFVMAPLSTNNILAFPNQKQYYTYNGTSWSTVATFGANGTGALLLQAEALDNNYFILFTTGVADYSTLTNGAIATRIGRFVDQTYGQTSTGTASGNGVSSTVVGYFNFDQNFIYRDASSTFLLHGRTTGGTIQPTVHTIYQAGG